MSQKIIASFECDITSKTKHNKQATDLKNLGQAFHNVLLGKKVNTLVEKAYGEIETIISHVKHWVSYGLESNLEDSQKTMLEVKISMRLKELDELAQSFKHKGQKLLNGTLSASMKENSHFFLLVGSISSPENRINLNTSLNIPSISSKTLGLGELSVRSKQHGLKGLMMLENALSTITCLKERSTALRTRLEQVDQYLSISIENHRAANTAPNSFGQTEEFFRVAVDSIKKTSDDY